MTLAADFADRVLSSYDSASRGRSTKGSSVVASAAQIQTGHPAFADLAIGESRTCEIASIFLDLSKFTARTFWDAPAEVTDLAHAVLSGFTSIITEVGGHVLGLRGDGLFACFGPTRQPATTVAVAASACAAALWVVQEGLNPRLEARGMAPVQARAGADYGEAVFVRSGTAMASEVNIVGFTTNFAAKCEKSAAAWELVVGQGFADQIADPVMISRHKDSPKQYSRGEDRRSYHFYQHQWRRLLPLIPSLRDEINHQPLSSLLG